MIGLDTNVLVRYIMQDDPRQSALATRLIESLTVTAPGYFSLVSVTELSWVLSSAYDLERSQLAEALEGLLRTKEIVVEQAETVWKAVRLFRSGNADFADCLIGIKNRNAGCETTVTLDQGTAKLATFHRL